MVADPGGAAHWAHFGRADPWNREAYRRPERDIWIDSAYPAWAVEVALDPAVVAVEPAAVGPDSGSAGLGPERLLQRSGIAPKRMVRRRDSKMPIPSTCLAVSS